MGVESRASCQVREEKKTPGLGHNAEQELSTEEDGYTRLSFIKGVQEVRTGRERHQGMNHPAVFQRSQAA